MNVNFNWLKIVFGVSGVATFITTLIYIYILIDDPFLVSLASIEGFPVAVAWFLIIKLTKEVERLRKQIDS